MRIPFPNFIPLTPLTIYLGVLLAVQLMEGTDPIFALLMLLAQLFAVLAFNTLGGMSHVAGSFCLFALLPNVTIPEIVHAILLQPGDFNLAAPLQTSAVCAIFFAGFYVAARFVPLIPHPRRPVFDRVYFSLAEMRAISIIATILSLAIMEMFLRNQGEVENGSFLALILHFFPVLNPLAVVLATRVCLQSSGGRSAMNWLVALIVVAALIPGTLGASKEGMITPIFCWVVVCAAYGYRFTRMQFAALAAFLIGAAMFIYPYAQNTRDYVREAPTISAKIAVIVAYIRNPSSFPNFLETENSSTSEFGEASSKIGILWRMSELSTIDDFVSSDQTQGFTGITPYLPAFLYLIPHFIWPNRPQDITSNTLARKAGVPLAPGDYTTQVTLGAPGMFYDLGGWLALPVYTILEFAAFFYVLRCLVGKASTSLWGLLLIGATAYDAGICLPSLPIEIVEDFLLVYVGLVACLKAVGYVSEVLLVRQTAG